MHAHLLGLIAVLAGLVEYGAEVQDAWRFAIGRGVNALATFHRWFHHNLAARVRPWLWTAAAILTLAYVSVVAFVGCMVEPAYPHSDFSSLYLWTTVAFFAAVLPTVILATLLIGVRPINWPHIWRLQEYHERLAQWHPPLMAPQPPPGPITPAEVHTAYGPNNRLRLGLSLVSFFTSFWILGAWFLAMGVALMDAYHVSAKFTAVPMLVGALLILFGAFAFGLVALMTGSVVEEAGKAVAGGINLLLRPIRNPPTITLPIKDAVQAVRQAYQAFFATLGLYIAALLVWPYHEVALGGALLMVIGAVTGYVLSQAKLDNFQKIRQGAVISTVTMIVMGGLYRLAHWLWDKDASVYNGYAETGKDAVDAILATAGSWFTTLLIAAIGLGACWWLLQQKAEGPRKWVLTVLAALAGAVGIAGAVAFLATLTGSHPRLHAHAPAPAYAATSLSSPLSPSTPDGDSAPIDPCTGPMEKVVRHFPNLQRECLHPIP